MLKGIYTPIVTPFTSNGDISYEDLSFNINKWKETGLEGLVVLGSNGEFPYIAMDEKMELTKFVISEVDGKKKIVVGTGCESTRDTIDLTNKMASIGADYTLILPPHYYKKLMDEEVLYRYFTEVADNSDLPVILYNMPMNTGIMMSSKLISKLSYHKNIIGVKDTSGNIAHFSEIIRDSDANFSVLAGNAGYLLPALVMGGKGGTVALANCLPDECCKIMELYNNGEYDRARSLQLDILEINKYVTGLYGIPALKIVLNELGYKGGYTRKPLMDLGTDIKKDIVRVVEEFKNKF